MTALTSGPVRLDALATRVGSNMTRLHRLETGQVRDGRLVEAYERALDLPVGSLRSPIDITCRGFPYAAADSSPGPAVTSVREMSRLTDLVGESGTTGGQWLTWARALGQAGAIGMPEAIARALMRKLVSELARSVGGGYPARYEALALLRCSGYGDIFLDVAKEYVGDPDVQVLYDLMSAVGEAPSDEAVAWCLELLFSTREQLTIGGAIALENMAEVSGRTDFWVELINPLLAASDEHPEGSAQRDWISHLIRLVPRQLMAQSGRRPSRPLAPTARMDNWSRTRLNNNWSECQTRAEIVCKNLGVPDQPVMARLLFDFAMAPQESRAVTSYMLLGALPRVRTLVGEQVANIAETHPDAAVRDRAARRLTGALYGDHSQVAARWMLADSAVQRDRGFLLTGAAGELLTEAEIRSALADGLTFAPLYAAAMTGNPCLKSLGRDRTVRPEVAAGARWWIRQGGGRLSI